MRRSELRRALSVVRSAIGFVVAAACFAAPARAQQPQFVGPSQCLNCHDHDREKDWYIKGEQAEVNRLFPASGKQAGHLNSQSQLEDPKAAAYAKAIGLKDVYDVKGACASCHGTVFAGDINAGVSCEKCHGAASAYLTIHQTKGAYDRAVAAGMTPVIGKPDEWARQCYGCHIVKDDRLVNAGHKSGVDFDLGKKYKPVAQHFRGKSYNESQIAAAWSAVRSRDTANASPVATQPAPPPAVPPAATPLSARGGASPKTAPTPGTKPVAPPSAAPSPSSAPAPAGPTPAVSTPPPSNQPPAIPQPVAPPIAPPIAPNVPPPILSPSAALAAAQGRVITALTTLLQQGARAPVRLTTPDRLVPYGGPDAALIELQQDAIALALQVLGRGPKAPGDKK